MTNTFQTEAYGPVFQELISGDRINDLGPGKENQELYVKLKGLDLDQAFGHTKVKNQDMARCCIAAVWLLHNFLEESHTISQGVKTSSGSYWHGIMHRREPDASNSKYWFRNTGNHPIFPELNNSAKKIASEYSSSSAASTLQSQGKWDPFAFIDLCESSRGKGNEDEAFCQQIQKHEWELLFDYCYQNAVA